MDVDTLIGMGYPLKKAEMALRHAGLGGIEEAVEWLAEHENDEFNETESVIGVSSTSDTKQHNEATDYENCNDNQQSSTRESEADNSTNSTAASDGERHDAFVDRCPIDGSDLFQNEGHVYTCDSSYQINLNPSRECLECHEILQSMKEIAQDVRDTEGVNFAAFTISPVPGTEHENEAQVAVLSDKCDEVTGTSGTVSRSSSDGNHNEEIGEVMDDVRVQTRKDDDDGIARKCDECDAVLSPGDELLRHCIGTGHSNYTQCTDDEEDSGDDGSSNGPQREDSDADSESVPKHGGSSDYANEPCSMELQGDGRQEKAVCHLRIRLTDGRSIHEKFSPREQLAAVRLFVELHRTDEVGPFVLMTNFPKRYFNDEDMNSSLESLGLTPSAVIFVKKVKK